MTKLKRIKKDILEFQYNSELIIIFIQLSLMTVMLLRYLTIPRDQAFIHGLLSDPFMLLVFTGLVLLKWAFLYKKILTHGLLAVFVVAEMVTAISAARVHELQFNITQDVILNTNVRYINYIILLIALRTLRFDPLMVFLSGVTAAIGWIVLTLNTLSTAELGIPDISYHNSELLIYLFHEAGRVLVILFITAILTIALYRARSLLWRATSDRNAIKDLSRFFDSDIAEKITHAKTTLKAGQGERREAAVLFIDLRGFTKTTEILTPKEVILLLSEYQTMVVPIIHKHKGVIDKFMGDGIMASFGATSDSSTYAKDALSAVDEIIYAATLWKKQRLSEKQVVIDIGLGLAIGKVIFGVIGDAGHLEYTVIGNAVNLAAKLEKHNKVEHSHAITTYETLSLAISQGYYNEKWPTEHSKQKIEDVEAMIDLVVLP